jgi:hypothetical protein
MMEFLDLFHNVTLSLREMFRNVSRDISHIVRDVEVQMNTPCSDRKQFPTNRHVHNMTSFRARGIVMTIDEHLRY